VQVADKAFLRRGEDLQQRSDVPVAPPGGAQDGEGLQSPPAGRSAVADTDVAVIGAGPYGLSVSAHLTARGVRHEIFGEPMYAWRNHMPAGMYLKSEGFATNLGDPSGEHTLERFCAEKGLEYGHLAVPVRLDTFVRYGCWFQERLVPKLDTRMVRLVRPTPQGFELTLSGSEKLRARRVFVATGMQGYACVPSELRHLPPDRLVHSYDYRDPTNAPDAGVLVVGAGQSGIEAAALTHEHGGAVRVVARRPKLRWNRKPEMRRSLWRRVRYPASGLGQGMPLYLYSNYPLAFHAAPRGWRLDKAFSVLGPAGAWWLRPRLEGQVEALLQRRILEAQAEDGGVRLRLQRNGEIEELVAGQVLAATGYRPDVTRLSFLDAALRTEIASVAGAPVLDRWFESSVPGLFFVGFAAAPSFGPVMRFVYGADFTARRIAGRVIR
jgi:FAD-dependent urate hydroxylase